MAAFAWAPSEAADNRSTVDHSASDEMIVFCDEGDGKNIEYHNSLDLQSELADDDQQEHEYHNSLDLQSDQQEQSDLQSDQQEHEFSVGYFTSSQQQQTPTITTTTVLSHYPSITAGFVSMDQGIRPATAAAYPFVMPGQYVTQIQYPQQLYPQATSIAPIVTIRPSPDTRRGQQSQHHIHVKKPLNSFMLFMKEKREEVGIQFNLKDSAAINKVLGQMWRKLDKTEQDKYYQKAREERAKHFLKYPGWTASQNYACKNKQRRRKRKQPAEKHDDDDNPRKCRALYGNQQYNMWCGPCRLKKRCIIKPDNNTTEHTTPPQTGEQ